jgi:hypothetical protein
MVDIEGSDDNMIYDPETGLFHWLANGSGRRNDLVAGHLHSTGYVQVTYRGERHLAHRLSFWFMTGAMPRKHVDHINGVRDDNRWSNLREATRSENMRNMGHRGGASGHKGVSKNGNGWKARIKSKDFGEKYLGQFTCEKEAALSYNYAAVEHFGAFARFNQTFEDVKDTEHEAPYVHLIRQMKTQEDNNQ